MTKRSWPRAAGSVLALATVAVVSTGCGGENPTSGPRESADTGAVEVDATSKPPWAAPTDSVPARVAAARLDLGPMGVAEHYHPRLTLRINGEPVPVAPNIGVDSSTGAMSAVHTHEADGTIHIEADAVGERFTLGQLFTQWGVKLSETQIGGVRAAAGKTVIVMSDGKRIPGDPAALPLAPDQEIVLELP